MGIELDRLGAATVELPPEEDALAELKLGDGTHQLGLTRMAASPGQGVVDEDCRVHGARNLAVASSSVFPTAGAVGPTLTIVALAIRAAEGLARELTMSAPFAVDLLPETERRTVTDSPAGDPYAPAAAAGIHRLAIPTPFAVGRVNVYLIEDEPLTLVDAGPELGHLVRRAPARARGPGTRAGGHRARRAHPSAHRPSRAWSRSWRRTPGAEVAAIDVAVPFVENFSVEAQAEDDFARDVMLRHGIRQDVTAALQSVSRAFRAWGARVEVTRVLHDGGRIELRDRTFEVAFRPGHSPSDTVFWDRERGHLIAGRPPAGPHLLEPADHPQVRRVGRALAGADRLPGLAAPDARDGRGAGAARTRRPRSWTTGR